jgi:tRNA (guanine-N7-)-methyltransferase
MLQNSEWVDANVLAKIKSPKCEHFYRSDFKFKHKNPYHQKLAAFGDFVLRDHESEIFQGQWNESVFNRSAPLCVEIGSGFGSFMVEHCTQFPEKNFIGMDYRFKRTFELANKLKKIPHRNFRYLRCRGERLEFLFSPGEVDEIFYFFPDPWPRPRHHKKRLFKPRFLQSLHQVLKPGGKVFIKTDHDQYADWMKMVLTEGQGQFPKPLFSIDLESRDLYQDYSQHFLVSFQTHFEKIFLSQQIKIKAFQLTALS